MLTVNQPQTYGYQSVHDLPTPPSASRPSPPLVQEHSYRQPSIRRSKSPVKQQMSTSHRGLPPPAALTLPPHQQQPPSGAHHAPAQQQHQHQHHPHHQPSHQAAQPPPPPPPPPQHQHQHQSSGQLWAPLPAPPPQWQGSEESMRTWLQARTEEEKTKQEEEKTRQETLRLEQRKIEADMLRESLGRGVPPPMVPLVFAGMATGGVLPQAALDWAQQFMPPSQSHQLQIMAPQGPASPHHQREHSGHTHAYAPAPSAAGPTPGPYQHHPSSPNRPRTQTNTMPPAHAMPHGAHLPSLNTNVPQGPHQGHPQPQGNPGQQESSPSIYFHHWQPPGTQQAGGSSNRPGTPSGETSKKRKSGPSSEQQTRSPPPPSNNPGPNRRGHKRQRSDMSWYRSTGQERAEESDRSVREASPAQLSRERSRSEVGKHPVSLMLSNEPSEETRPQWQAYGPTRRTSPSEHDPRSQGGSSRG